MKCYEYSLKFCKMMLLACCLLGFFSKYEIAKRMEQIQLYSNNKKEGVKQNTFPWIVEEELEFQNYFKFCLLITGCSHLMVGFFSDCLLLQ